MSAPHKPLPKPHKPHIKLKAYTIALGARWTTSWPNDPDMLHMDWMYEAIKFAAERNRQERRGVHAVK